MSITCSHQSLIPCVVSDFDELPSFLLIQTKDNYVAWTTPAQARVKRSKCRTKGTPVSPQCILGSQNSWDGLSVVYSADMHSADTSLGAELGW